MKRVTLQEALARWSSDLGPECDWHDVEAYNEALERAWPSAEGEYEVLTEPVAERLCEMVTDGQLGRDRLGRDWVKVAKMERGG